MYDEEYRDDSYCKNSTIIKLTPDGNVLLIWEDLPGGRRQLARWSLDDAFIIAHEMDRRVEQLEAVRAITERDRRLESDLNIMKWFDYRYITPAAATRLFADTYVKCYRRIWRDEFDKDEAVLKRPLRNDDPLKVVGPEHTTLWHARQWADALEYPYDFFIRETLAFARKRRYKRPPLPNQLYGEKMMPKLVQALSVAWRKATEARARHATSPQFRNENYRGDFSQDAHHEHIISILRAKGPKPLNIRRFVFDERLLPEDKAIRVFGKALVERGRAEPPTLEELPAHSVVSEGAFWPSCYGLPGSLQDGWPCTACDVRAACEVSAGLVRKTAEREWGDSDPRAAHHRAKATARKHKERAKKKAAAASQ